MEPLKRPAAGDTVPAGNTPLPQVRIEGCKCGLRIADCGLWEQGPLG